MPSLLNLSRIMIFNVHTWLPVTLFNLRPDQEIYRFNYSLMTSQLRRGGKKGQHIFENVNLNNVFWVCWKKPLSNAIWVQQHQASFSPSPSLFPERWESLQHVQHWGRTFLLSGVVICEVISQDGLYLCSVPLLVMQRKYVLLFDGLAAVFPLHKSKDAALCL